jgi:hypothetical protein
MSNYNKRRRLTARRKRAFARILIAKLFHKVNDDKVQNLEKDNRQFSSIELMYLTTTQIVNDLNLVFSDDILEFCDEDGYEDDRSFAGGVLTIEFIGQQLTIMGYEKKGRSLHGVKMYRWSAVYKKGYEYLVDRNKTRYIVEYRELYKEVFKSK